VTADSAGTKGLDLTGAVWRKSTQGLPGMPNSVEVASVGGMIVVRNADDPDGPKLVFNSNEWDAFVEGAKEGEFDI
jgi:hypothetical protein